MLLSTCKFVCDYRYEKWLKGWTLHSVLYTESIIYVEYIIGKIKLTVTSDDMFSPRTSGKYCSFFFLFIYLWTNFTLPPKNKHKELKDFFKKNSDSFLQKFQIPLEHDLFLKGLCLHAYTFSEASISPNFLALPSNPFLLWGQ